VLALGDIAPPAAAETMRVPRAFLRLAAAVACHRDAQRWEDLYRVLWRLTHGDPRLLDVGTDPDVHRLVTMERAVRRAAHKMKAFVRFRLVTPDDPDTPPRYVAWFEPAQHVVERVAPGELQATLEKLVRVGVTSLVSRPPTLEELFLRHYA
jgi:DNA polymerase